MKIDKRYLKYGLHAAIAVGLVVAGFKYLKSDDILRAFRAFDYRLAPYILLLAAGYLAVQSLRFGFLLRPLVDLPWNVAMRVYAAGQAATLLPGGVAVRAALLNQVDVSVAKSAAPVAFSSILNQSVLIVASLVAALWLEAARTPALVLLAVLAVAGGVALVPHTRRWLAGAARWVAAKFGQEDAWDTFLESSGEVASPRVMAVAVGLTTLGVALKVIILDLVLRGTGSALPYSALILAYVLPTMLGRLSGLPAGGIGVTEAGMVGVLVSVSSIGSGTAAAAVAIYRVATVLFLALLGGAVYAFGWRGEDEPAAETP